MRDDAFRSWLLTARRLDTRTVRSRLSNCRTVERYEGDLDHHFDQDHLRGLLARLEYSTEQEKWKRPAGHRIPINGNVRNGTATLKSAVSLYKQFREDRAEGAPILTATAKRGRVPPVHCAAKSQERGAWPTWDQPGPEQVFTLARLTVPFVRFLNPDVIRAVVEDNDRHRATWIEALQSRQIDPSAYLWEKSSCAFPGVRRYAGSREIAAHRGHTRLDENQSNNALALDDNDYPKQLWSFVFRGGQFSKFGPEGYALAHLADHKEHGNRFGQDFEVTDGGGTHALFGLYTCPSNAVYIPLSLIKPTDFVGTLRALLVRRAQQLYGEFCEILPPFLRIPDARSAEWNLSAFRWADPVGTTKHIQSFLEFRSDRLEKLINGYQRRSVSAGEPPRERSRFSWGEGDLVLVRRDGSGRSAAPATTVNQSAVYTGPGGSRQTAVASPAGPNGSLDQYIGCLLGGAVGDALGAPIEFMGLREIRHEFGSKGVTTFVAGRNPAGSITDDTQMTMFTAEGLLRAYSRWMTRGICAAVPVIHHAYLRWLKTQGERFASGRQADNYDGWLISVSGLHARRAPGNTCLSALIR